MLPGFVVGMILGTLFAVIAVGVWSRGKGDD